MMRLWPADTLGSIRKACPIAAIFRFRSRRSNSGRKSFKRARIAEIEAAILRQPKGNIILNLVSTDFKSNSLIAALLILRLRFTACKTPSISKHCPLTTITTILSTHIRSRMPLSLIWNHQRLSTTNGTLEDWSSSIKTATTGTFFFDAVSSWLTTWTLISSCTSMTCQKQAWISRSYFP